MFCRHDFRLLILDFQCYQDPHAGFGRPNAIQKFFPLRVSDFYRGGYTSVLDGYDAEADAAGGELDSLLSLWLCHPPLLSCIFYD